MRMFRDDLSGRPEHLDKVAIYPVEVEGMYVMALTSIFDPREFL